VEQDGMVLDLSVNGIYVMTDILPNENESLTVSFRVPGNDRLLHMNGVVAWVNPHQAHPVHSLPPGFGFCFMKTVPDDMKLIIRAIQNYCRSNPLYRQYL
jgi:hypothetical protein